MSQWAERAPLLAIWNGRLADPFALISDFDGFRGRCIRGHLPISHFLWYSVYCEYRHDEFMILSGADYGLLLHISMDGPSDAIRHLERAGGITLPDVADRSGIVKYGGNE